MATQFRPQPQPSAAFATQAGWKKGVAKPGANPDEPDRTVDPGFTPGEVDPGISDPGPGTALVDPAPMDPTGPDGPEVASVTNPFVRPTDPMPMDPVEPPFEPEPEPMSTDEPGLERLVPRSASLTPTPELLAGGWRGEPKHYVLEKGEWVEDTQFFVVDFGKGTDKKDNEIDVVRVSFEVEGNLVKLMPVPYTIDADEDVASFSHPQMGPDPIVARAVAKDRIEIRGKVQGFTVVRYYSKIPG